MSTSSSFIWDEESRELLLFDYLEGNLPEDKAAMFQQALAADPALQAELSSWQASVVAEPFYPTGQLEAALLKIPQTPSGISYSGLAWSLVFLLLLSLVPAADHPLQSQPTGGEKHAQNLAKASQQQHPLPLPHGTAPLNKAASTLALQNAASTTSKAIKPLQAAPAALLYGARTPEQQLPLLEARRPAEAHPQRVLPLPQPLPKAAPVQQKAPKKLSRQQARKIRQMKERALRQKQANEFIKGNRPYVVPLDTKNF